MSLQEAADFGQVIAALAVLGTLVFVGVQIRQNTQFQKLSVVDALSTAVACITHVWWPRRCEAFSKAFQAYLATTAAPADYASLNDIFEDHATSFRFAAE